MSNVPSCISCGKETKKLFISKDYNRQTNNKIFTYNQCYNCGTVSLLNIPNDLNKYYSDSYYWIPDTLKQLEVASQAERYKIDIVKKFITSGSLIEIGPASGGFAYLAKESGFNVRLIELNERCCNFLRDTGKFNVVHCIDELQAIKDSDNVDVIALWHVIEHLSDPWEMLTAISDKLNKNGVLILAFPNISSLQFKLFGRFWTHLDAPRHIHFFPSSLIIERMKVYGLRCVMETTTDIGGREWDSFGWQHTMSNIFKNYYLKILTKKIGICISKIFSLYEQRKDRGSTYTLVFKKEVVN